jgi:hypothetical protein
MSLAALAVAIAVAVGAPTAGGERRCRKQRRHREGDASAHPP